jgi:hypothetical protein
MEDENLRLVLEPPEGGGVDDPVAIAAKGVARRAWRLWVQPAATVARIGCIGGTRATGFNGHHSLIGDDLT